MRFKPTAITATNCGTGLVLNIGLNVSSGKDVDALVGHFRPGNEYELKHVRRKRSLDANAYFWILVDKIAQAVNSTKEEVYHHVISQVGVFETLQFTSQEAMQRFKQEWHANGLGWGTRTVDKENFILHAYYGSSRYDSKEMSILIDYTVQAAKELGIETLTPDELARMKESWGKE